MRSKDGFRIDPRHLSVLVGVSKPETASNLCDFVHCLTWISKSIPDFSERVTPLRTVLEEPSRRAAQRQIGRFKSIRSHPSAGLRYTTTPLKAYRSNYEPPLSYHIGTRKKIFSYLPVPVTNTELVSQLNATRARLSRTLRTNVMNSWQDRHSIMQIFRRMDYLLLCEEPRVLTDHRKLFFCYSPTTMYPTLGRRLVIKVLRWTVFLSQFQYRS